MLVLTRRANETIVATTERGERIEFTVLRDGSSHTRIGVRAPASVTIDRGEVDKRKQLEREK